jgi:hypothetical protein
MKKKFNSDVEILDAVEVEEEGFIDGEIKLGKTKATFNFGMDSSAQENKPLLEPHMVESKTGSLFMFNNKAKNTSPKGITPAVDGESYSIKRGYQFRPSTIRKLHEIRARHSDVNVYLNTILDEAILHYYNYLFNSDSD